MKIIHLRRYKNGHLLATGGVTAAYELEVHRDGLVYAHVALAVCDTRDVFNRRIGRRYAIKRFDEAPWSTVQALVTCPDFTFTVPLGSAEALKATIVHTAYGDRTKINNEKYELHNAITKRVWEYVKRRRVAPQQSA